METINQEEDLIDVNGLIYSYNEYIGFNDDDETEIMDTWTECVCGCPMSVHDNNEGECACSEYKGDIYGHRGCSKYLSIIDIGYDVTKLKKIYKAQNRLYELNYDNVTDYWRDIDDPNI